MTDPIAFSAKDAAAKLGVSTWTIHRLVKCGDLAKIPHLGTRVLIARVELERFAAQGVQFSVPAPVTTGRVLSGAGAGSPVGAA